MCWVRPAFPAAFAENTLLLISGVSYVVAFLLLAFSFFYFWCWSSAPVSQAATRSVSLGICTARRSWCFARTGFHIRFGGDLLGGSGLVCCMRLNGERVGKFSTSIGTGTGLPRHQLSTLAHRRISFFACGREADGWMDGEVGSVRLAISRLVLFNRICSIGDNYLEG